MTLATTQVTSPVGARFIVPLFGLLPVFASTSHQSRITNHPPLTLPPLQHTIPPVREIPRDPTLQLGAT